MKSISIDTRWKAFGLLLIGIKSLFIIGRKKVVESTVSCSMAVSKHIPFTICADSQMLFLTIDV